MSEIRIITKPQQPNKNKSIAYNESKQRLTIRGMKVDEYREIGSERQKPIVHALVGDVIDIKNKRPTIDPVNHNMYQDKQIYCHSVGSYLLHYDDIIIKIKVDTPKSFPVCSELNGIGMYFAPEMFGKDIFWWIKNVSDSGMSYMRIILPANCWVYDEYKSIFYKDITGLFNLGTPDWETLVVFRTAAWYALRLGVILHFDIMDMHLLRNFPDVWARSEFNGINNAQRYPMPQHYVGGGAPWQNVWEHIIKNECDHQQGIDVRKLLFSTWETFVDYLADIDSVIFGDGNEMDSRSASREILGMIWDAMIGCYPVPSRRMVYGGMPLGDDDVWENDPSFAQTLKDDDVGGVGYLALHGASPERIPLIFDRIRPVCEHSGNKVLFSTDGIGSGQVRGQNGRPSCAELMRIYQLAKTTAGEYFGGLGDIKLLGNTPEEGLADAQAIFAYWKENA